MLVKKACWILTILFIVAAVAIGYDYFRLRLEAQQINILAQFTGMVGACIIVLIMPYKILRIIWALLLCLIAYQLMEDSIHMKKPTYADYILPCIALGCALYAMYDEFIVKRRKLT